MNTKLVFANLLKQRILVWCVSCVEKIMKEIAANFDSDINQIKCSKKQADEKYVQTNLKLSTECALGIWKRGCIALFRN